MSRTESTEYPAKDAIAVQKEKEEAEIGSQIISEGAGAQDTAVVVDALNALELESENVHKVYNEIAEHFSNTRYKPWPVVDDYLK